MPEFVLNRAYNLVGRGHNIRFEKGQPTYVPPELANAATAIGAECVEGPIDVLGPEVEEEVHLSPDQKAVLMFAAFDRLTARNAREDFGGDGKPSMEALKKHIEFAFTKKEVGVWFQKYREAKAE